MHELTATLVLLLTLAAWALLNNSLYLPEQDADTLVDEVQEPAAVPSTRAFAYLLLLVDQRSLVVVGKILAL